LDEIPLAIQFAALALLLVLSGFFAMAETGMMAINRYRLRALRSTGHRGARLASELLRRTDRLLSVLRRQHAGECGDHDDRQRHDNDLFGHDRIVLGIATVAVTLLILVSPRSRRK